MKSIPIVPQCSEENLGKGVGPGGRGSHRNVSCKNYPVGTTGLPTSNNNTPIDKEPKITKPTSYSPMVGTRAYPSHEGVARRWRIAHVAWQFSLNLDFSTLSCLVSFWPAFRYFLLSNQSTFGLLVFYILFCLFFIFFLGSFHLCQPRSFVQ